MKLNLMEKLGNIIRHTGQNIYNCLHNDNLYLKSEIYW